MKKYILSLLCLLAAVVAQAETLVSGGRNRNMLVYSPKDLPAGRPLLISMHGATQNASYQREHANYEAVADTAKFVVVYPDGEGNYWDLSGMKDINFILDIIDEMARRYSIDKNRVYLSGFSMGGMMTYYAMNKIADRIAAFAPCSGYNIGGPNAVSSRPVPILHVHGTADDVCSYAPVQSHLDAWVRRNGCNPTPRVEKPKTGPANTSAEMIRYVNGLEGVEVAHLKLPGKGHWHSNDPVVAMTNIEVWNFCQRWSLAAGPALVSVSPEDGSFDLSATADRTFTFEFDQPVDCSKAKCSISEGTMGINLQLQETGFSTRLTFVIPAGKEVRDLEYRMQLREITGENGGKSPTTFLHYTFGVEEVGDVLRVDTLLTQDWPSQQGIIGEGIPEGWHRVNANTDGGRDERLSGEANTGGCRMKYFTPGGDFDAGFYFSSREYNQATFTYGDTPGRTLPLTRGHYRLSFRSAYWNDGARNNGVTFGVSVVNAQNGNMAYASPSLAPSGCLSENSNQQVKGSRLHDLTFEVTQSADYLLQYTISAGWDGIILGPPTLTRCPSQAEQYKGEFLRALREAQQLLERFPAEANPAYAAQLAALAEVVGRHESLVSTAPSVYAAALAELRAALTPLLPLGVTRVVAEADAVSAVMHDVYGRPVRAISRPGLYLRAGQKLLLR